MNNTKKIIIAVKATLITGFCAGYLLGTKNSQILYECINLLEQGNAIYSDIDKTTWKESLTTFQKAKELTDKHNLPLPDMEIRIRQLQEKMKRAISQSIETAKFFYEGGSPSMAITTLENEALIIDPDHKKANQLKEEYLLIVD